MDKISQRRGPAGLSRRSLLTASGVGLLGVLTTTSCSFLSTEPDGGGTGAAVDPDALEAPSLRAQVEDGSLPPLEERLPQSPLVIEGRDGPGVYGGTWENAMLGPGDAAWLSLTVNYENLVRWNEEMSEVIPNLAESWEVNEGATVYTFHLRSGVRWSDGEPFTSADVVFAHNDVNTHPELNPAGQRNPAVAEAVDEHTVTITFERPEGLYLKNLATMSGIVLTNKPRHYLEQFHADYNEDVATLAEQGGFSDWVTLFQAKGPSPSTEHVTVWENLDLPTLHAWVTTTPLGEGNRVTFERNPYYWKTDADGRQLPYMDRVVVDVVEDAEVKLLRALDGHVNIDTFHINSQANKPVLAADAENGDYRLVDLAHARVNVLAISFNLAHKDPALRELFQNRDFRIGMSHAINRQELIDVTLAGQGEPWQTAPHPDSPLYNETFAKQYTEFDVDLANQHLDEAGLDQRDASGIRLRPDGSPVRFNIAVTLDARPGWPDQVEMIRQYWAAVGIEARTNNQDRTLFYDSKEANDHDCAIWTSAGIGLEDVLSPIYAFPSSLESNFAIPWARWFLNDPAGEEPPSNELGNAVKEQMELYNELLASGDESLHIDLMRQIQTIAAEQFLAIGIALEPPGYTIVKNGFMNIPEVFSDSWLGAAPALFNPCSFFFAEP